MGQEVEDPSGPLKSRKPSSAPAYSWMVGWWQGSWAIQVSNPRHHRNPRQKDHPSAGEHVSDSCVNVPSG